MRCDSATAAAVVLGGTSKKLIKQCWLDRTCKLFCYVTGLFFT